MKILRLIGCLLLGLCLLGVGVLSWAYLVEPNLLFVRQTDFRFPRWQSRAAPLKVVVVGDFHFRPSSFDVVRAQRYVQRIMQLQPDLIVLLGDYANGLQVVCGMPHEQVAALLKPLKAPGGVFAIQGNHDHAAGWGRWKKELNAVGIRTLDNRTTLIQWSDGRKLQLSGVLDFSRRFVGACPRRISPNIPHILLCHRPEADRCLSPDRVDFVISGHTHGGQICLPFDWLHIRAGEGLARSYVYPWHVSPQGNVYLITKGLGTSILPLRFNCPPEILLLRLH